MRRSWQALSILAFGLALVRCGGTVETVAPGSGSGAAAGHAGVGHAGAGHAGNAAGGTAGIPLDAAFDVYVDPGCPDATPPPSTHECDPFSTSPTCPEGEGCYPFVDHPFGAGCGTQTFGTICSPVGIGHQGDDCSDSSAGCASGFVCVVGSEPGKHCVQLCSLSGPSSCPRGMICGELDVEG